MKFATAVTLATAAGCALALPHGVPKTQKRQGGVSSCGPACSEVSSAEAAAAAASQNAAIESAAQSDSLSDGIMGASAGIEGILDLGDLFGDKRKRQGGPSTYASEFSGVSSAKADAAAASQNAAIASAAQSDSLSDGIMGASAGIEGILDLGDLFGDKRKRQGGVSSCGPACSEVSSAEAAAAAASQNAAIASGAQSDSLSDGIMGASAGIEGILDIGDLFGDK